MIFGAAFSGVTSPCCSGVGGLPEVVGFGPIVRGVFGTQRGAGWSLVKQSGGMSHASALEHLPERERQKRTGAARFCFQNPGYTGKLYCGGEMVVQFFVTEPKGGTIRLVCLLHLIKEKRNLTRTEFFAYTDSKSICS